VIGPDTTFLRGTAARGGGVFMPTKNAFTPPGVFACQMPVFSSSDLMFPTNTSLSFSPAWLSLAGTSYSSVMANSPIHGADTLPFPARGAATSLFSAGPMLLYATSRDDLLKIHPATGSCVKMLRGAGGRVAALNSKILAGPSMEGEVMIMDESLRILWSAPGDSFTASKGSAYLAEGSFIHSYSLSSGRFQTQISLGAPVTAMVFDPCAGVVIAGTDSGNISIFDQDLQSLGSFAAGIPGTLNMIRSFTLKNTLYIFAATESHVLCSAWTRLQWTTGLDGRSCTGAVVMDSHLFLTTWSPGPCGGIDTGSSTLLVLKALDGSRVSETTLFRARAFGPVIDLESGVMVHGSWGRESVRTDISSLAGVRPLRLGTRVLFGR